MTRRVNRRRAAGPSNQEASGERDDAFPAEGGLNPRARARAAHVEDDVLDALAVQLDLDLVPLDVPVAHGGEPADAQPALRPAVRLA